jgi:hypothetical protein
MQTYSYFQIWLLHTSVYVSVTQIFNVYNCNLNNYFYNIKIVYYGYFYHYIMDYYYIMDIIVYYCIKYLYFCNYTPNDIYVFKKSQLTLSKDIKTNRNI